MAEGLGGSKPESFKPQQEKLEFGEQKVGEDLSEGKSKNLCPPEPLKEPERLYLRIPFPRWRSRDAFISKLQTEKEKERREKQRERLCKRQSDSSLFFSKDGDLSESYANFTKLAKDMWEREFKGLDAPFTGVAEIVPPYESGEGEDLPEGKFEHLELPDPNIPHEAKILTSSESGVDISSSGSKFVVLSESGLGGSKVGESSLIFKGNNREQGGKGHRENDSAEDEVWLHFKRKLEGYEGVEDLQQGKVNVGALISRDSPSDKGKEEEDARYEFLAFPLKVLGRSSSENPVSVSSSDLVCPTDVEEGGKEDVERQVKDEGEEEEGPWTKEDWEAWWKDRHGTEYTPDWGPRDVPEDETLLASWERYHKQIEDSEGYDITEFPANSMAAPITPLFNFKECSETLLIIRELTSAAVEKFNEGIEKEEDRYEVHDILTANVKCPRNCWYYITFQAKKKGKSPNTEGAASPLATFQARVLKNFIDEEEPVVEECRIKSS